MKKYKNIALFGVLVVAVSFLTGYDAVNLLDGPTVTDGGIVVNNGTLRVGVGATPDVTPGGDDLFVEGTAEIDGATRIDGAVDINSTLDVSGAVTLAVGAISAADITDNVGVIQLPLHSWRTDANPPLDIAAATTPNISAEGNFDTVEWATGETTQKITTGFVVPQDYVSTMELHGNCALDAAAAATADTVGLDWYNAKTGEADNPTVVDEGAGTEVGAETLVEITVAMDGGTLEAGDSVRLVFGVDAADQTVHCIDLWVEYTKTQ